MNHHTSFKTESGSVYETKDGQIRRVTGQGLPTPRVGEGWRKYSRIDGLEINSCALIHWTEDVQPPAAEGTQPATVTSRIVHIDHHGDSN